MDPYDKSLSTSFKRLEEAQDCAFAIAQGADSQCVFYDKWQERSVPKSRAMTSLSFKDLIDAARSQYFSTGDSYEAYCSGECVRRSWRTSPLDLSCGNRLMVCRCPRTKLWRVGRIGRIDSKDCWQSVSNDYGIMACLEMTDAAMKLPWSIGRDNLEMLYPKMAMFPRKDHDIPSILYGQLAEFFAKNGFTHDNGAGHIYALKDFRDNRIRYVGQTVNLHSRYKTHLFNSHTKKLRQWISSMLLAGSYPVPECLEICDVGDSIDEREKLWINIKTREGCDLLNTAHMKKKG